MATDSTTVAADNPDSRSQLPDDSVPTTLSLSLETFRRELPTLLTTHRGQWVAHRGTECAGLAKTAAALYQQCFRRGLKDDEFLVSHISPEIPDDEITWSSDV